MINADLITMVFLVMLILSVIMVVITEKLINAAIYMGTCSIMSALVFLLLGAPDVALAEVIIGSTLSTIIYLIAIKKFRLFTIYLINNDLYDRDRNDYIKEILDNIEDYLKTKEMQINSIHTNETINNLSIREDYSIIIEHTESGIILHSNMVSLHNDNITSIVKKLRLPINITLSYDMQDVESPYREGDRV